MAEHRTEAGIGSDPGARKNSPRPGESAGARQETREAARAVGHEVRETAESAFEGQKRAAAGRLHSLSVGLRESAESLEGREEARVAAPWVRRVADGLDRVAGTLEREDPRGLFAQTERLARRNPSAFLGGAAAAGFAVARFLRSSSERRRWDQGGDGEGAFGAGTPGGTGTTPAGGTGTTPAGGTGMTRPGGTDTSGPSQTLATAAPASPAEPAPPSSPTTSTRTGRNP